MMESNLDKYLHTVRRIEEHREENAVKELQKLYKQLIKDLRNYMGNAYADYSDPETGKLTFADLHAKGLDARLLEEVAARMNEVTQKEKSLIKETVEEIYRETYAGMVNAVDQAANSDELHEELSSLQSIKPETVSAAVNNPVHGLTLTDQLEKHREEIVYGIKQAVGVGLSVGDNYTTMAKRIQTTLIGPDGAGGSYAKSVRIARTEAHRVRETGNFDAAQNLTEKLENAGFTMMKTWHTMKDERVRPNRRYKTKSGWKTGKPGKYNHVLMDGVSVPINEKFKLPSGAETMAPGQSGVAGEDINCRCYLSYETKQDFENWAKRNNGVLEANGVIIEQPKVDKFMLDENGKHAEDFFDVGYNKDDGTQLFYDITTQFDMDKAVEYRVDTYGKHFNIYMQLGKTKKKRFCTGWMIDVGKTKPRFVTAFRKDKK